MNLRHRLCVLCALCALLPATLSAQNGLARRLLLLEASTHAYPELVVRAGVYDGFGRTINDLRPQEIAVTIDGQPATANLQVEQRPPAVVIVADMSSAMNDVSLPGQGRVPTMVSQLQRLLAILPPDSSVSLVAFDTQERLEVNWSPSSELTPTLELLLKRPLPAAAPNAPYPLTSAISLGLRQFSQADPLAASRPRALFVYAAGVPQQTIDASTIQRQLDELAANPPLITIVGLGSNTPGAFAKQPGNPDSLIQAANSFPPDQGAYCRFFSATVAEVELLQAALDRQSEQVANLEPILKLSLADLSLAPGVHQLDLAIHEITVTQRIRIPAVAPTIALPEFREPLADRSPVSVRVAFAQQPVREVAYYLDGQPIGVSTASPDFVLTLDLAQYRAEGDEPTTHQLAAIATDSAGQQSERSVTSVQIAPAAPELEPKQEPSPLLLAVAVALGAIVFFVLIAGGLLVVTPRGRGMLLVLAGGADRRPAESRASAGMTIMADGGPAVPTEFVQPSRGSAVIEVISGDQRRSYPLSKGKAITMGRGSGNEITLTDGQISQRHAQLESTDKGVRLTDLGSRNGTFVGERKRKLEPNTPELLRSGESFWLGQNIRLIVR